MSVLRTIKNPFGGIDEQAMQDQFEDLVGGRRRAERLFHLYKDSYPGIRVFLHKDTPTREDMFRGKALREGFTDAEVDALLDL